MFKKEKPIWEKSIFEICEKGIYTQTEGYTPTGIRAYKDRMEISIHYCEPDADIAEEITVTVAVTGERLLPFEIYGKELYWDTFDDAIRIKVMPEGEPEALIPAVLVYPNDVLTMTKEFAEKNYSDLALSYATFKDGVYIWYYPDGSLAPVMFETPRLFPEATDEPSAYTNSRHNPLSGGAHNISNHLFVYAEGYVKEMKISGQNYFELYNKNMEKGK
ncbi:MAG: hypothetical protein IJ300_06830 [Clostridia bacterium]|nr:hypothetical protein [Clostridia bacterium]